MKKRDRFEKRLIAGDYWVLLHEEPSSPYLHISAAAPQPELRRKIRLNIERRLGKPPYKEILLSSLELNCVKEGKAFGSSSLFFRENEEPKKITMRRFKRLFPDFIFNATWVIE